MVHLQPLQPSKLAQACEPGGVPVAVVYYGGNPQVGEHVWVWQVLEQILLR